MAIDLARQPTTRRFILQDLKDLVEHGRIRIPHFQRDFKWESRDVVRLFDSIARGFPVGSLLLWQRPAPAAQVVLGALTIGAPQRHEALWVVDGQQRITSLVNALVDEGHKDDRFAVYYDLEDDRFVGRRGTALDTAVPLPVLFDLRRLLEWFQSRADLFQHVTRANEVASQLHRFEIPGYVVDQAEIEVLQDIFDRMNNFGKRLSRAEVFSALNAPAEHLEDRGPTIGSIAAAAHAETGFGLIDEDTVLRVVLVRRGPDVTRDIHDEFRRDLDDPELAAEGAARGFERARVALVAAIRFLQDEAGVPHFSLLPYRYLLVVITRFFAHYPQPAPRNRDLLVRWFWRAALLGPEIFKGSATGAMRALSRHVVTDDETVAVQNLIQSVAGRAMPLPGLRRFNTSEGATRIVLCALWSRGPRRLLDGEPVQRDSVLTILGESGSARRLAPEVVSRRKVPAEWRASAANRLFQPPIDEASPSVREQIELSLAATEDVLESQALDSACRELLLADRVVEFLLHRHAHLEVTLREFVRVSTGQEYEDTPPLHALDFDDDWDDDLSDEQDAYSDHLTDVEKGGLSTSDVDAVVRAHDGGRNPQGLLPFDAP